MTTRLVLTTLPLLLLGCPADDTAEETGLETTPLEPFDADLAEQLQQALDQAREDFDAPGLAAAVQMPDTELWVGVTGVANQETQETVEPEHRFKLGSITKTFVAAVVLQLVEEGALGLDDPLGDHYGGLPWASEVTLRQMLQHSSGVPEYGYATLFQLSASSPWTDEELMALMEDWELAFEPGTDWLYSNGNYVLLGLVIQAVTGETWDRQVNDRLLEPYSLGSLEAPLDDDSWGGVVPGYWNGSDTTYDVHPSAVSAAGAMVGNAEDVARWGTAWLGGSVVGDDMAAERWVDAVELYDGVLYCGTGLYSIGGGPDDPDVELMHNGVLNGYSSWMGYRADGEVSLTVLTNSWPGSGMDTGQAQNVAEALWATLGWEE